MRAILSVLFAIALAAPMLASATDTVNFGQRVITLGDSVATVYQVAGEPSRVVQLQNKFGAGLGERLEYFVGSKVVQITVRDSRVVGIEEIF